MSESPRIDQSAASNTKWLLSSIDCNAISFNGRLLAVLAFVILEAVLLAPVQYPKVDLSFPYSCSSSFPSFSSSSLCGNSSSWTDPSLNKANVVRVLPCAWPSWPTPANQSLCHDPGPFKFQSPKNSTTGFPLLIPMPPPNPTGKQHVMMDMFRRGFLFTKPTKVGGSTATGISLRMAKNMAERLKKDFAVCDGNYPHGIGALFQQRARNKKSFLWSLVREPTKRCISWFYHFQYSRQGLEPTRSNFVRFEMSDFQDYYIRLHTFQRGKLRNVTTMHRNTNNISSNNSNYTAAMTQFINNILNEYDFIAVTERFDESMVVMQMLLDVPLGDALYLKAKSNGGYDGGGSQQGCTLIQPALNVPQELQDYLQSDHWKEVIQWDLKLYQAVNQSLDMTIDRLGRSKFEEQLQRFQMAQTIVEERCGPKAIWPCSANGTKRHPADTNCLFRDAACGYQCMDEVAQELNLV